MDNLGKKFEKRFEQDFLKSIPNSTIDRIYDTGLGYKAVSNVSDFIGYKKPCIYYLECKTKKGKNFPFTNLTQYDKLIKKVGIEGVRVGIVLWFYECDKLYYIPISTIKEIMESGAKSISIKSIEENKYRVIEIPSIKKRTFLEGDYSILTTLEEGE